MDKSEVIILSSDDESETRQLEKLFPRVTVKRISVKLDKYPKTSTADNKRSQADASWRKSKNGRISATGSKKQCQNVSKENPEVVDLEECLDNSPNDQVQEGCGSNGEAEHVQSHLKLEVINIDAAEDDSNKASLNKICNNAVPEQPKQLQELQAVELNDKTATPEVTVVDSTPEGTSDWAAKESPNVGADQTKKDSNKILGFFTEFVEFCGSLETIASDRIRLTKKLMKRYGEADPGYIESPEFRDLIQKSREKVNMHNLYLVAKDVSAELSFRKQIKDVDLKEENGQIKDENDGKTVGVQEKGGKKLKKRAKFIRKIFNKLEEMGNKIRELEVEEVDLSDEEESSYVRLQRYRERYCMIYKKLCKYTNEIPDIDHLYNPKICFAESKYPTINKCIEVWLNKIKRFPDFTDIMKLLESQSASLGLPSNRESLRTTAIEIFQQVGTMLQRRRKYDLWDSFCGFLGDQIDPAVSDPVLEKVLKDNFDIRMKKEQEIFQHYTDLQEREKLEPEEVPEEEANCSPVESGNEDEKEIEDIENNILKRLDSDIEEGADKDGDGKTQSDSAEEAEQEHPPDSSKRKESKNNYKNCKSMKWRSENSGKSKSESDNSEDADPTRDRTTGEGKADVSGSNEEDLKKAEESGKKDSDLELLPEEMCQGANSGKKAGGGTEAASGDRAPQKRASSSGKKFPGKKKCVNYWENEENDNCRKSNESFDVKYCHVFADVFESFGEEKQDGKKRKVFRDMTNVNRLMKLHGKNMNASGWFTPSFFQPVFRESEKPSWKRRFQVSFRMVGSGDEKCALSQEEGAEKKKKFGAGRESNEKNIQNNSGRGGDGRGGFCSGRGGESHEDGDEDRNRKNGKTGNDRTESKPEEEEDDEDDRDEGETETRTEATGYSQSNDKTEEPQPTNDKTDWPLEVSPADERTNSLNCNKRHKNDRNSIKTRKNISEVKEEAVKSGEPKEETSKSAQIDFCTEKSKSEDAEKYSQKKLNNGKQPTEKESSPVVQDSDTEMKTDELVIVEKLNTVASTVQKFQPKRRCLPADTNTPNENTNEKQTQDAPVPPQKSIPVQSLRGKAHKKKPTSASDEERVKRFLMNSPSSISITPPRKLTLSKPPSEAALQALATLRNLKGISATVVKGRPRDEDDVMVIGSTCKKPPDQKPNPARRNSSDQNSSAGNSYPTPRIVTVVGNVSGFENYSQEATNSENNSSPIKISNVWGNLPNSFIQSMEDNEAVRPGCSRRNSQQGSAVKKKSIKKEVEYVVIE